MGSINKTARFKTWPSYLSTERFEAHLNSNNIPFSICDDGWYVVEIQIDGQKDIVKEPGVLFLAKEGTECPYGRFE